MTASHIKMYSIGELKILDKKRLTRVRVRETHRWTEEETNMLLDNIIAVIKNSGNSFERPTARKFYSELCAHNIPHGVDWLAKKHKLRHLKASYVKAKEWKENVASELFESDKQRICERIKKLCPYYNKLDEIFGPILNSDPIGPMVMDEETIDNTAKASIDERYFDEEPDNVFVPKQEIVDSIEEPCEVEPEESEIDISHDTSHYVPKSKPQNYNHETRRTKIRQLHSSKEQRIHSVDMDQMKFNFEKEKFELNYSLENRKLSLEKEKLEFEKTKFFETQKLRKYELDKQFELRKLEIQKEERMQRLEFDERTFEHNEN